MSVGQMEPQVSPECSPQYKQSLGDRSSKPTYVQFKAQTETQACWEAGVYLLFTPPSPTCLHSRTAQCSWST